jgi:hypothetical protein
MKKKIVCTATMSLLLMFIISFAYGDLTDRPREGKKVVEKSTFTIDQAQKLIEAKSPDRAWLADEGQLMIKQGTEALNAGKMMKTNDGKRNMGNIGQKLLQTGNLLLKMGQQKGPVTPQEKEQLLKQGEMLQSFGKMMLKKGQVMGGE